MFDGPKANRIENWTCVMESSDEFEISIAQGYLESVDIPSNILSKKDSSYSMTMGEMSAVFLYVPNEYEEEARQALEEWRNSESEADDMDGDHGDYNIDDEDHEDDNEDD